MIFEIVEARPPRATRTGGDEEQGQRLSEHQNLPWSMSPTPCHGYEGTMARAGGATGLVVRGAVFPAGAGERGAERRGGAVSESG